MLFNVEKCKIMHIGSKNPRRMYNMDGKNLIETFHGKDLRVLIDFGLDFGNNIKEHVGRENRMIGRIRASFSCLNMKMFRNLYMALIRTIIVTNEVSDLIFTLMHSHDET